MPHLDDVDPCIDLLYQYFLHEFKLIFLSVHHDFYYLYNTFHHNHLN